MTGYLLIGSRHHPWPPHWKRFLEGQTLLEADGTGGEAFELAAWKLPPELPRGLPPSLLEELAWGLWAVPEAAAVIQPTSVSLRPDEPPCLAPCPPSLLSPLCDGGGIALCRQGVLPSAGTGDAGKDLLGASEGRIILAATRSLFEEKRALHLPRSGKERLGAALGGFEESLRRRFPEGSGERIPAAFRYLVNLFRMTGDLLRVRRSTGADMARRRSWEPVFPVPEMPVKTAADDGRIRLLVAMHWLELGGAEKFAMDLVRHLPRDQYAVYLTTDVPSENSWEKWIAPFCEEIVHLPRFLPRRQAGVFFDHFIRTRKIRLLHIHHSAWAYESLPFLRRFHPALAVLDTLHIIELPPHSGGYPEWSSRHFDPFIDCRHVSHDHLHRFLRERWRIPEEKIRRIYLNAVNAGFERGTVEAGSFRSRYGIAAEDRLVAFSGRFVDQKRPLEFLKMAALLAGRWKKEERGGQVRFVMAGRGPLRSVIVKEAEKAGIEGILTLTGELEDTRPLYRDADVIVLPSENEGLALVTYEGLAMGTVVVSTDVGGQREILPPEMIVPDVEPLAPALAEAVWPFLVDRELCRRAGEEGRERILREHRPEETYRAFEGLYRQLLEKGNPAS